MVRHAVSFSCANAALVVVCPVVRRRAGILTRLSPQSSRVVPGAPMPIPVNSPGVYVEPLPGGVHTIQGVATSIALFAGWCASGPVDRAERIAGFADFQRLYGGLDARSLLGHAVRQFFDNGGSDAFVLRVAPGPDGTVSGPADATFAAALLAAFAPGSIVDGIDLVNLVCVPGLSDAATIAALQKQCRARRAFLLVDSDPRSTVADVVASLVGKTGPDAMNSAFFFPWLSAPDPMQHGALRDFAPCGSVAGVFARTDVARGVWKAPAGTGASLHGVAAPRLAVNDAQGATLGTHAVNCLRSFAGTGTVVWGARTLAGDDAQASQWKYVPVRRFALYLEESLLRGTRWAVLEPNGEPLWAQIRLVVGNFLHALFLQGAMQGRSPAEAYFVRCDRTTMSQADVDGGVVNIVVGFAPLKPAEFVVIELQQIVATGQSPPNCAG
jgi:phage tail sheath protein FI